MGNLFNQLQRMEKLNKYDPPMSLVHVGILVEELLRLTDEYKIEERTAIEILKLSVKITDYDIKDEQLAGFGELLEQFIGELAELSGRLIQS